MATEYHTCFLIGSRQNLFRCAYQWGTFWPCYLWVSSPLPSGGDLVDLSLCASNEGLFLPALQHRTFSLKGVAGLSFTARIGRAPFHRARSASKKDGLAAPFRSFSGRALREHKRLTRLPPSLFVLGCRACWR